MFTQKAFVTKRENLEKVIQLALRNFEAQKKDPEYKVFNIVGIGRLMEGEAYYHEVDSYYRCVGLEIEIESQFSWKMADGSESLSDLSKEIGFYSLWVGKSHKCAPITFETGNSSEMGKSYKFDNGCGDHVTVLKDIFSTEDVAVVVEQLGLLNISK